MPVHGWRRITPSGCSGGRNGGLLDLGNPEAWKWVVDHVDSLITEQGIDAYRQDFNIDPLSYWRAGDAADRQGITEIRHVTGYLAYLGRTAPPSPGSVDRLLCERRAAERPGDVATGRATAAQRLLQRARPPSSARRTESHCGFRTTARD